MCPGLLLVPASPHLFILRRVCLLFQPQGSHLNTNVPSWLIKIFVNAQLRHKNPPQAFAAVFFIPTFKLLT